METPPTDEPAQGHGAKHCVPSGSRAKWVFIGFAAVAVFFLFTEHRAHLFGILPYLFLLACPLMHFFHHGGHGHHHGVKPDDKPKGGSQ